MSIYAVVALTDPEKVGIAVQTHYAEQSRAISSTSWLIADDRTAAEVSSNLELSDGGLGAQGVVLAVSAYTGFAPAGLWDWLKSRWVKKRVDE